MKTRCDHQKVREYARKQKLEYGLFRCPDCDAPIAVRDAGKSARKDTHSCAWAAAQEIPDERVESARAALAASSAVESHAQICRLPYLKPEQGPWGTDCYCLCCNTGFNKDDLDPDDPTYCPWCGCRVWWYNETFESSLPKLQQRDANGEGPRLTNQEAGRLLLALRRLEEFEPATVTILLSDLVERLKPAAKAWDREQREAERKRQTPIVEQPSIETLERWMSQGVCEAIDGCRWVEPDGYCEHGQPSWLLYLGLI